MNEKKKTIISIIAAVLLVIGLVIIFMVACNGNEDRKDGEIITQAVTNAQGEVVTDASGEVVTEVVQAEVVTNAEGEKVTEQVTDKKGETVTNSSGEKVTQQVTKPVPNVSAPKAVKNLKVEMGTTTAKLTWKADGNCDGYLIDYALAGQAELGNWTEAIDTTETTITIEGLNTQTAYTFRVTAYNGSRDTAYAKGDAKTVDGTTKVDEEEKNISLTVLAPVIGKEDTLEIYVNGELMTTKSVVLAYKPQGSLNKADDKLGIIDKSLDAIVLPNTYKGNVTITVKLIGEELEDTITTDSANVTINLTDNYIDYVEGGLD